ncbi:hypothetical protein JCM5350_001015 [Sporobolomyces pararoseus]
MSRPPSPSQSIRNPTERWEEIRSAWLTPSTSCSTPLESNSTSTRNDDQLEDSSTPPPPPPIKTRRNPKDAVFAQRIKTLEQMLRAANSGESSIPPLIGTPASPTLSSNGKGKEKELEMEEPDDGFAVGGEKKGSTQELKKISEGIFLAFKQGRALKEALPLSLVTSLLFRSWLIDGTIPRGYTCATAEPDPPMPVPLSQFPSHLASAAPTIPPSATTTFGSGSQPSQKITELSEVSNKPSPLDLLSELNPRAVTPLPSGNEEGGNFTGETEEVLGSGINGVIKDSEGGGGGGTNTPDSFSTAQQEPEPEPEQESSIMPPPPLPPSVVLLNKKPALQPLQSAASEGGSSASLEGMGADETSGKLKLDVLRGSRWRTERDVASGSDII